MEDAMKKLWETYFTVHECLSALVKRVVHFVAVAGFFVGLIYLGAMAILLWLRWVEMYGL
jgi:hypothetical protein